MLKLIELHLFWISAFIRQCIKYSNPILKYKNSSFASNTGIWNKIETLKKIACILRNYISIDEKYFFFIFKNSISKFCNGEVVHLVLWLKFYAPRKLILRLLCRMHFQLSNFKPAIVINVYSYLLFSALYIVPELYSDSTYVHIIMSCFL